jgi:hypothetical protein
MWDRQTHLSLATYRRWWVLHLWVEGFFEVFATVVIAFLFTRMGLLRIGVATVSVLFATSIFLAGGIIGKPPALEPGLLVSKTGRRPSRRRPGSRTSIASMA